MGRGGLPPSSEIVRWLTRNPCDGQSETPPYQVRGWPRERRNPRTAARLQTWQFVFTRQADWNTAQVFVVMADHERNAAKYLIEGLLLRDHFTQLAAIVVLGFPQMPLGDVEQHRMNPDHFSGAITQQVLVNLHPNATPIWTQVRARERKKRKLLPFWR